jgi:hypothetical protein
VRQAAEWLSLAGANRLLESAWTDGIDPGEWRRPDRRVIPARQLEALWHRADLPVREKTLWRLLYDTAARAETTAARYPYCKRSPGTCVSGSISW